MQTFLASDVLYQARTAPLIKHALDDAEIGGQKIASSRFLPGIEWLSEQTVAAQLGQQLTRRRQPQDAASRRPACTAPGSSRSTIGDTTLQPDAPNRVPAERRHRVRRASSPTRARTTSSTSRSRSPSRAATSRSRSRARSTRSRSGQTAEASLALGRSPPTGAAVTVKATVAKVPGEQKTDNNTAEYDVLFTG